MVCVSKHAVRETVVCNVSHGKDVGSADRLFQNSLGFPGAKAGTAHVQKVGVYIISAVL